MLPRHARCVFSRLCCNGHSLLLSSYLSRIGRIENPSCSACGHPSQDTSDLILHCPATDSLRSSRFGDSLVSLRILVQALESYPASGAPWSSAMPPSLERGRVTTKYSLEFCSLSSTNSDFKLTLIIPMDLLFLLTTSIDSNLSEYRSAKFGSHKYKASKIEIARRTIT